MRKKRFKVRIPATTANFGPGFDSLGAALTLYCEVEAIVNETQSIFARIDFEGEGEDAVPCDEKNIIWRSMKKVFERHKEDRCSLRNLQLRINNNIPIGAGLGSSAAARLAGIVLAYKIMGKKVRPAEILALGIELEEHSDNIVPAFFGGFCVSAIDRGEVRYVKFQPPALKAVLCVPYFQVPTHKARKILPKKISRGQAVFNISRALMVLASIQKKQYENLSFAMQDTLHQPYREKLVPHMKQVFEAASRAGAYGVALSGAGPSLLALCSINKAEKVGRSMHHAWEQKGINSRFFILDFDTKGIQ